MISQDSAHALLAFIESFDLRTTGVWKEIEDEMRNSFGIEHPEEAISAAREELQGMI